MSQYNDQCAAIRAALKDAGFEGVNVNTVVSSQGTQLAIKIIPNDMH